MEDWLARHDYPKTPLQVQVHDCNACSHASHAFLIPANGPIATSLSDCEGEIRKTPIHDEPILPARSDEHRAANICTVIQVDMSTF